MIKENQFEHQGRTFAVRALAAGDEIAIRVYEGESMITPVSYVLRIEPVFDLEMRGISFNILDGLMTLAESDVKNEVVPLFSPRTN